MQSCTTGQRTEPRAVGIERAQMMLRRRPLNRNEIRKLWKINRAEVIDAVYYAINGELVLKHEHYDIKEWPKGEEERYYPIVQNCYDRGGWAYGIFLNDEIVGAAVLENRFIGRTQRHLQLLFLQKGQNYRGQGSGKELCKKAAKEALLRGAEYLHVSATPSENTINFYLKMDCRLANEPDPASFELEPEDIHLEYNLEGE
jgi:GNAT superfamily N-acetyltransferase